MFQEQPPLAAVALSRRSPNLARGGIQHPLNGAVGFRPQTDLHSWRSSQLNFISTHSEDCCPLPGLRVPTAQLICRIYIVRGLCDCAFLMADVELT